MKYLNFELSEKDIVLILNSLSYFRNEVTWHDSLNQKERVGMYFNFKNNHEYVEQFNHLDLLHKRISVKANQEIYDIKNEIYFIGQQRYLVNKDYGFINDNLSYFIPKNKNNYTNKNKIKYFVFKTLDKFRKIV